MGRGGGRIVGLQVNYAVGLGGVYMALFFLYLGLPPLLASLHPLFCVIVIRPRSLLLPCCLSCQHRLLTAFYGRINRFTRNRTLLRSRLKCNTLLGFVLFQINLEACSYSERNEQCYCMVYVRTVNNCRGKLAVISKCKTFVSYSLDLRHAAKQAMKTTLGWVE